MKILKIIRMGKKIKLQGNLYTPDPLIRIHNPHISLSKGIDYFPIQDRDGENEQ